MSAPNRANIFTKLQRTAKKHYPVVKPPSDRSVLEHLLYGCCLENSQFDQADEALARIQRHYFDWNEVRVTTGVELAEVMGCLNQPQEAATRLKKTLNSVFETLYAFDIDYLKKENLGKAIQVLDRGRGVTPFVISYVAQNGLGGHQIAVDESMVDLMYLVGAIDEKEKEAKKVPGLERAIPKTKGVEFFSTVHQLAVAFRQSPFKPELRKIILSINADAKERFPKRASKATKKKKAAEKKKEDTASQGAASAKKKSTPKASKKTSQKKAAGKKTTAKKSTPPKKTTRTNKKASSGKSKSTAKSAAAATKSSTGRLKKKKPR